MKKLIIAAAFAALGLIGAVRAAQTPKSTASCCDGGSCCVSGAACCDAGK